MTALPAEHGGKGVAWAGTTTAAAAQLLPVRGPIWVLHTGQPRIARGIRRYRPRAVAGDCTPSEARELLELPE
jgi:hypothetical protein